MNSEKLNVESFIFRKAIIEPKDDYPDGFFSSVEVSSENSNGQLKPEIKKIKLSEIVFDENIYPRKEHDPLVVQKYADCL